MHATFLTLYSPLLAVHAALLCVYSTLLSVDSTSFTVHAALLTLHATLLAVYAALLTVHAAFGALHAALFVTYVGCFIVFVFFLPPSATPPRPEGWPLVLFEPGIFVQSPAFILPGEFTSGPTAKGSGGAAGAARSPGVLAGTGQKTQYLVRSTNYFTLGNASDKASLVGGAGGRRSRLSCSTD